MLLLQKPLQAQRRNHFLFLFTDEGEDRDFLLQPQPFEMEHFEEAIDAWGLQRAIALTDGRKTVVGRLLATPFDQAAATVADCVARICWRKPRWGYKSPMKIYALSFLSIYDIKIMVASATHQAPRVS